MLLGILAVACAGLEECPVENPAQAERVEITASAGILETKTVLSDGSEKISVGWEKGEEFSVLQGAAAVVPAPFVQTGEISADGKSSSFRGSLERGGASDLYAFSPALPEGTASAAAVSLDMSGQDAALDASASYMYAKASYVSDDNVSFSFVQLTSVLKLNLKFPEGVSGAVSNARILASEGLTAKASLNLVTGELAPSEEGRILLNNVPDVSNASTVAYVNALPGIVRDFRVQAVAGGKTYSGTISSGCKLASGKAYSLNVNMTLCDNCLDVWKEGYMDIHQISTGCGNAAFLMLPDGTTMMIDMGDMGKGRVLPQKPSDEMAAAQWVERYIRNFYFGESLDYCLITHYHSDHIGAFDEKALSSEKGYLLQGITHFAELMPIDKMVDRSWPKYSATDLGTDNYEDGIADYSAFMNLRDEEGKKNEKFSVGSASQFVLLKKPEAYPDFSVRNFVGNLWYWTGLKNSALPALSSDPDENRNSCGIRISYGDFDWLSAGDIKGDGLETKVTKACGPTEAVVCNHHAYSDAMYADFIKTAQARVWIVPACTASHPHEETLQRLLSRDLYSGERSVFSTGMAESNKTAMESKGVKSGHIVIRVYEGGKTWQVFVLNDESEEYEVIYKTGILNARSQTFLDDFIYDEL